jgi:hypothetical protein
MNDGMNGVEIMVTHSKAKFSERFCYFYLLGNMIKNQSIYLQYSCVLPITLYYLLAVPRGKRLCISVGLQLG